MGPPIAPHGLNRLECKGNYSATSNNIKLVHWPLMGGLLHLVQRWGDWAGPQLAQAPPRCTKSNSPPVQITVMLYNEWPLLCGFMVTIEGLILSVCITAIAIIIACRNYLASVIAVWYSFGLRAFVCSLPSKTGNVCNSSWDVQNRSPAARSQTTSLNAPSLQIIPARNAGFYLSRSVAAKQSGPKPNLHWLPIQHRILYKVAVLTFKCRSSATAPTYLSRHIKAGVSERTLRSSTAPLLDKPFTRTDFANRAFRCSSPTVWNSLPETIIRCDSLSVFKSKVKTYFFHKAFD